jgi:hypothetical protein
MGSCLSSHRDDSCEYQESPTTNLYRLTEEDEKSYNLSRSGPLYHDLDESKSEFRLLLIPLTTDPEESIACLMFTASNNPPPFTALSYMWGDETKTTILKVNGVTKSVTVNLGAAIKQIRNSHPSVLVSEFQARTHTDPDGKFGFCLWADALCINQDDNLDKSYQVPLMGRIYPSARQVISYIGDEMELEDLQLAFRVFETIHLGVHRNISDDTHDSVRNIEELPWLQKYPWLLEAEDTYEPHDRAWQTIDTFFRQEYFTRLWVQQEMGLARELFFFSRGLYINMHPVIHFVAWKNSLKNGTGTQPPFMPPVAWMILTNPWLRFTSFDVYSLIVESLSTENLTREDMKTNFFDLVMMAAPFLAKSPLDKVFALSALPGAEISINYDMPARDLYQKFVEKYSIEPRKDLTFLHYCGRQSSRSDLGLPSWVPDLSQPFKGPGWGWQYSANQGLELGELEVTPNRHLRVNGCVCEEVVKAEPRYERRTKELLEFFLQYASDESNASLEYPSGGSRKEAFLRSCLFDAIPNTSDRLDKNDQYSGCLVQACLLDMAPNDIDREFMLDLYMSLEDDFPCLGLSLSDGVLEEATLRAQMPTMWLGNYRFFHTKKGYLGICNGGAEVGSEICVVAGCKYPLLKKVGDCYELIEVCFVLGFMDGEVAKQLEAGILQEQVLEIC